MPPIKHTSVFIVDDSDTIRQRLGAMLRTLENVEVTGEARSADEAIQGISVKKPDVVLLDLKLGTDSGMDVLKSLMRNPPSPLVVVLTNHAEPQYRKACLKAGARYFFDKSTQFDCVKAVVSQFDHPPTETRP